MPSLRFNKRIYKKETIQKAVCAYSHLASFKVKDRGDYTAVKIEKINPEHKSISDEFANYVLGMSKKWM